MTKKDYLAIGKALAYGLSGLPSTRWVKMMYAFNSVFAGDNRNFDPDRFRDYLQALSKPSGHNAEGYEIWVAK